MRTANGFALIGSLSLLVAAALAGCPPGGGAVCGNGTCEAGENATNCASDCSGTCGNGTCDAGETEASCPADCTPGGDCGNGMLDAGEACEGGALGGETCVSQGFSGGQLACTATCVFDTSGCTSTGPDLIVYAAALNGSAFNTDMFITQNASLNACEAAMCAAGGTTGRTLLEFTLVSENIGNETLYFGSPSTAPLWEPTPAACGYEQFWGYATYWICPMAVGDCATAPAADHAADGWKGSFCFIENFGDAPDWTGADAACGMYSCGNMGQQPGCADDYYVGLDCQWIDITDVAPGEYNLCAHIDPMNMVPELNDDNNISCAPVTIP